MAQITTNHGQMAEVLENGDVNIFYPKTFSSDIYLGDDKNTLETLLGNSDISEIGDGSITGAITHLNNEGAPIDEIIKIIYPIGSIYMSVNSINPETIFIGTTWVAWGSGQVPVGVNADDADFNTVEKTGGAKSHSYTPAGSNTAVTLTAAQSGVPAHSHGLNSHTHSVGAHSHGLNSHTHSIPALSGTATGGNHRHYTIAKVGSTTASGVHSISDYPNNASYHDQAYWSDAGGANAYNILATTTDATCGATSASGNLSLSVTTTASTTGKASGSTANSTAFNSGGPSTANTANNSAANASASHNHTFTGTASTQSHLQPYITCYMWKRTA